MGARAHGFLSVFHEDTSVRFSRRAVGILTRAARKIRNLTVYVTGEQLKRLRDSLRMRLFCYCQDRRVRLPRLLQQIPVRTVYLHAEKNYEPASSFEGELVLFRATSGMGADEPYLERYDDPLLGWGRRTTQGVRTYDVPGGHSSMLQEPNVGVLAQQMQSYIDEVLRDEPDCAELARANHRAALAPGFEHQLDALPSPR